MTDEREVLRETSTTETTWNTTDGEHADRRETFRCYNRMGEE